MNELTDSQYLKMLKLEMAKRLEERASLKKYQANPILWLSERFGENTDTMFWSNYAPENHIWDGSKDPFVNAWMDLTKHHWVGVESCTGAGKTYYASRIALWFLDVFNDSLVITIGPTFSQLKDNLWSEISKGFKKFKNLRPSSNLVGTRLSVLGNSDDEKSWQMIARYGLATQRSQSGDDAEKGMTKAQGFHRKDMLFIIDEAPGVADALWNSIDQTCTGGNNLIIAFGNPDSEIDALHRFCKRSIVKHYVISAYDHPNVTTGKEIIPGAVTMESIIRRGKDYGEGSNFFNSRVRGKCPERGKNALFDLSMVDICINGNIPMDDTLSALGIDVANSKDGDKAALAFGVKNYLSSIKSFNCENASILADNVIFDPTTLAKYKITNFETNKLKDFAISASNIVVDGTGVGVSTINRFELLGYKVFSTAIGVQKDRIAKDEKGDPIFKFNSFRTQMVFELADDINNGRISLMALRDNQTLIQSIKIAMSVIQMRVVNGVIHITNKDEMKKYLGGKSPDEFDAIVYWNFARKLGTEQPKGFEMFASTWV